MAARMHICISLCLCEHMNDKGDVHAEEVGSNKPMKSLMHDEKRAAVALLIKQAVLLKIVSDLVPVHQGSDLIRKYIVPKKT